MFCVRFPLQPQLWFASRYLKMSCRVLGSQRRSRANFIEHLLKRGEYSILVQVICSCSWTSQITSQIICATRDRIHKGSQNSCSKNPVQEDRSCMRQLSSKIVHWINQTATWLCSWTLNSMACVCAPRDPVSFQAIIASLHSKRYLAQCPKLSDSIKSSSFRWKLWALLHHEYQVMSRLLKWSTICSL